MRFFKPNIRKILEKEDVAGLTKALGDRDFDVQLNACRALGEIGTLSAVDSLIICLNDYNWLLVKEAILMLGEIGSDRAVESLIPTLGHEDEELREEAAEAVKKIGGIRLLVESLISALGHKDHLTRINAELTLIHDIYDRRLVLKSLKSALSHKDENVRKEATRILRKLNDTRSANIPTVNKETVNGEGETALMQAIDSWALDTGTLETVKSLIESGANVNAKDKDGKTPLMQAAFYGMLEVAMLLVTNSANVNAKDNNGNTALNWATTFGHHIIAEILRDAGGKA